MATLPEALSARLVVRTFRSRWRDEPSPSGVRITDTVTGAVGWSDVEKGQRRNYERALERLLAVMLRAPAGRKPC